MVAQELKLVHIATGDLFRQAVVKGTELGRKAKYYMDRGELIPDKLTIQMVIEQLSAPDCEAGVVLDGFPRTPTQAKALDKALAQQNEVIDRVVYIKVSEEELVKRLSQRWICHQCQMPYHLQNSPPKIEGKCDKCGGRLYQRGDDRPETVRKRLEVYFRNTFPLIDYYTKTEKLVEVDGEGDVSKISRRIVSALRSGLVTSQYVPSSN
jgi:adenylate kinase